MLGFIKAWFTYEERRHIEELESIIRYKDGCIKNHLDHIKAKEELIEELLKDVEMLQIEADKTAKKASVDFIKKRARKKKEYRRKKYANNF